MMDEEAISAYRSVLKEKYDKLKIMIGVEPQQEKGKPEIQTAYIKDSVLLKPSSKIEYKFYSNINKLIVRLKLLVDHTLAGNDEHKEEIEAILNELQDKGFIVRH